MPIHPDDLAAYDAITEELALAINDAIVATTAQQKLAAKTRYKAALRQQGLLILRSVRVGVQGDY